jgi:dynein heavy chain
MPSEDIPTLNDNQVKHIKEYVYNTKAMIERNEDLTQLLQEANLDYARVMNKLVFVENLKQ